MALPPGEEPRQVEAKDKGNMEWIVKIIKLKKKALEVISWRVIKSYSFFYPTLLMEKKKKRKHGSFPHL